MHRLPLLPIAVSLFFLSTDQAQADSNRTSALAHLETTTVDANRRLTLTVRSTLVGAKAAVFVTGGAGAVGGMPSMGPDFFVKGVIDPNGRFQASFPLPGITPQGRWTATGLVLAPWGWVSSQPILLSPAGGLADYRNATALLPDDASSYPAADADWGDLDGDGDQDVVVANDGDGSQPLILINNGSFASQAVARLPAAALGSLSQVELGDVDGDGDLDLFFGGGTNTVVAEPNRLLLNDGVGQFALAAFPAGSGQVIDAELGDLDGDGDLDLVVANRPDANHSSPRPDPTVLYENDGSGGFAPSAALAALPGNEAHGAGGGLALGDVDNDADLDLLIVFSDPSGPGAQNVLYRNEGSLSFSDITAALPAIADNSSEAEFGDFNQDGLLDIFVANSVLTIPGANLLINLGNVGPGGVPLFSDASVRLPASFGPATGIRLSADVGDMDGDGDLDIVVGIHEFFRGGGMTAGETVVLLNRGGKQDWRLSHFEVDSSFSSFGSFVAADVSLGDMDGDGDLDVYIGSSGPFLGGAPPADRLIRNEL